MKSVKRFVLFWGVLLALVVVGQCQVTITGTVYSLEIPFGPPWVRIRPEPGVTVSLVNAANANVVARATSDANGNFRLTNVPRNIYAYALLTKPGFRSTATFLVHITADMTGVRLPIIPNHAYVILTTVVAIAGGVSQQPGKSIIVTFFHPEGRPPDASPGGLYLGAAIDARSMVAWPQVVPVPPPGDRRWLGLRPDGTPACISSDTGDVRPIVSLIFNAERWPHVPGQGVRAYRLDWGERWPKPRRWLELPLCPPLLPLVPGIAPTVADITVGVVRCSWRWPD